MKILGIDPGKDGAMTLLESLKKIQYSKIPLLSNGDFDIVKIHQLIKIYRPDIILLEKVHSVYGTSSRSNFNFGRGVGVLQAVCTIQGCTFIEVRPKEWQKEVWKGLDLVKDPKKNSLAAAKRLFPSEDFLATKRSKVPHNGIIDATLIAYYGYLKFRNMT